MEKKVTGRIISQEKGIYRMLCDNVEEGLEKAFADIEQLANQCRFQNCSHTSEPGCAVRATIESGELPEDRWLSYEKLRAENRYAENADEYLAEKKRKFKEISKINKSNRRK